MMLPKVPAALLLALWCAAPVNAASLTGKVTAVNGDTATIVVDGATQPGIGDPVEVFFKIGDADVSVGTGKITEAAAGSIKAKIDKAGGELAKDQLVRIESGAVKQPQPAQSPAAPGTRSALVGEWMGNAPDGSKVSFSFKDDNTVLWVAEDLKSGIVLSTRAKYRTDASKTPNAVEVFDVEQGDLKGETMRGIYELQTDDHLKFDMSIGQNEHPDAGFTDGSIVLERAKSPIVVPANAIPPSSKAVEAAIAPASASPAEPTPDSSKTPDEQKISVGHWRYDAKDYDGAIQAYTEAIDLNPKNASAFSNRGHAFHAKGDPDRAIADWNKAITLDPTTYKEDLGHLVESVKFIQKAEKDIKTRESKN